MAGPDRDIAARAAGDERDPAGSGDDRHELPLPDCDRAVRIGPESDGAGAAEGASKLISAVSSHPDSNAQRCFRSLWQPFARRPRSVTKV
jgi:hypothetical protein